MQLRIVDLRWSLVGAHAFGDAFQSDFNGRDFPIEKACLLSGIRSLKTGDRIGILLLAGEPMLFSAFLRATAHVPFVVGIPKPVMNDGVDDLLVSQTIPVTGLVE